MPLPANRVRRRLAIWAVALATLAACNAPAERQGSGAPPAAQNPPAAPSAPTAPPNQARPSPAPVTLNYGITGMLVSYWIDFVGLGKGFFTAEGVNLDLVLTETSTRTTTALAGGSLDLANNSPDSSILAVEKGADLVIVGEELARPVYTLLGQPTIQSVADLRGQRVGVSDLKSGATIVLLRTLARYGVGASDVDLIPAGRHLRAVCGPEERRHCGGRDAPTRRFSSHRRRVSAPGGLHGGRQVAALQLGGGPAQWARAHSDELVRFLRAFRGPSIGSMIRPTATRPSRSSSNAQRSRTNMPAGRTIWRSRRSASSRSTAVSRWTASKRCWNLRRQGPEPTVAEPGQVRGYDVLGAGRAPLTAPGPGPRPCSRWTQQLRAREAVPCRMTWLFRMARSSPRTGGIEPISGCRTARLPRSPAPALRPPR